MGRKTGTISKTGNRFSHSLKKNQKVVTAKFPLQSLQAIYHWCWFSSTGQ